MHLRSKVELVFALQMKIFVLMIFFILPVGILARVTVQLEFVSKSFTFGPDDEIYRTLLVPL